MTFTFPTPNLIDPASVTSYRWGIMGAAGIAEAFVTGVQKHAKQQIVAVASDGIKPPVSLNDGNRK